MSPPEHHHQAVLYRTTEELLDRVGPVLDDGVHRGAKVVAMVDEDTRLGFAERLGESARQVDFRSPADLVDLPAQSVVTEQHRTATDLTSTAPLLFLTQRQPWMRASDVALWEAAFNPVLGELPMTMLCASLDEPPFDWIYRGTHPELIESGRVRRNDAYLHPVEVLAAYPPPAPEPLAGCVAEVVFDSAGQLHRLRDTVRGYAANLGLPAARVADLALAVTEIATNSLRATGSGLLRIGLLPGRLTVELRDAAPPQSSAMFGLLPPPLATGADRVFWLARQLCDAVYVWHDGQGTGLRAACAAPDEPADKPTGYSE